MPNPAKTLPVLMYHHVSPMPGLVTVSPEIFRQHMQALVDAGWHSISTGQLESYFSGQPLPKRSLLITFDDGYLDNFIYAHPVLQALGLQATMFVVTDWIGNGNCRTAPQETPDHKTCKARIAAGERDSVIVRWSEIEAMKQAGTFEFHSHTHTHTRWDRQFADTGTRCAALAGDLAQSGEILRQRLGIRSRHLCWPQGYYEPAYLDVARQYGFEYLYTTEKRVNRPDEDIRHIGRIVTKTAGENWMKQRLRLFGSPWLARLYLGIRGTH